MIEDGYHKLNSKLDLPNVLKTGLEPSRPAEKHWLGAGVYFYLDPQGLKWAFKWPLKMTKLNANTYNGIVQAQIDTSLSLDLRDDAIRLKICNILLKIRAKILEEDDGCGDLNKLVADGVLFAALLKQKGLLEVVGFTPTAIIANFDNEYEHCRILPSKVILNGVETLAVNYQSVQIQICVIDRRVIKKIWEFKEATA